MMLDWIFGTPMWLWGTVLVALSTAVACCGLLIFHRLVHVDVRKAHNDLAGFTLAVVGVLYAVLLAFIAIATWNAFSKASDIVESESDYAGGIYFDTRGLPQAKGQAIRDAIERYVSAVINQEWPLQRAGKTPDQGWQPLRDLNTAIASIQPQNLGEAMIQAELLNSWNQLYLMRSSRLSAVQGHVPGPVWWVVFLGGVITTSYTYFFGYLNFAMHMAMTGILAATLALVVVLIIDLDRPFRGAISVSPDPFIMTQQSWSQVRFDNGSRLHEVH
jgi:hypothetical protein